MEILWHGQGCFELRAAAGVVVTDPATALRPPPSAASADLVSSSERRAGNGLAATGGGSTVDGSAATGGGARRARPFVVDRPGEYEAHGIFVISLDTYADEPGGAPNLVCCFDFPGLTVCHLGHRCDKLSQAQVETLGIVHVLFIPIDTAEKHATSLAIDVVNLVDPAIVIPIYDPPGDPEGSPALAQFLKEMGATDLSPRGLLRVDAGRLPEEPQVALLGLAR